MIAGHSHRFVAVLYSALAMIGGAAGIFWLKQPGLAFWCSAVLFPSLAWMLCQFVVAQERQAAEEAESPQILPTPQPAPTRRAA